MRPHVGVRSKNSHRRAAFIDQRWDVLVALYSKLHKHLLTSDNLRGRLWCDSSLRKQ